MKKETAPEWTDQSLQAFVRKVDWNLCRDFLAIARYGGVGAAARATGRRQPSLSAALRRFEAHVGHTLCDRSSRGVVLTPMGVAVLALCRDMAGSVMAMPLHAAAAAGRVEGTLRLCMIPDVAVPAVDEAIMQFNSAYPAVSLHIDIAPWRQTIEAVERGDADIGITCDDIRRQSLRYVTIGQEAQQLYCVDKAPLLARLAAAGLGVAGEEKRFAPRYFTGESFILTGGDEPRELRDLRARYGLGESVSGQVDTLSEARRLVLLGVGIGFLPIDFARPDEAAGRLVPLLPDDLLPRYPIYMITRTDTPEGTAASLMTRSIVSRMAERSLLDGEDMQLA
mgnify:CR=1 FL=1